MKTETIHSSIGWEAGARSMADNSLIIRGPAPDFREICQIRAREDRTYGEQDENDQATATFIVRACNSHAELLEASFDALALLVNGEQGSDSTKEQVIASLRAVIAKAQGN